jgi:hypothetical protein
LQSARPAAHV